MSQDTYFIHFAPMGEVREGLNAGKMEQMEIQVCYTLGGPNYFSGGQTPRGLYLDFWPVVGTTRKIPDDRGHRIYIERLARKSAARGEAWASIVRDNIDEIATLAIAGDWEAVKAILEPKRKVA